MGEGESWWKALHRCLRKPFGKINKVPGGTGRIAKEHNTPALLTHQVDLANAPAHSRDRIAPYHRDYTTPRSQLLTLVSCVSGWRGAVVFRIQELAPRGVGTENATTTPRERSAMMVPTLTSARGR